MKSNSLGVVVVRMQVPQLHDGHRYLLNTVTAIHEKVLVLVGSTPARLTPNDPLTFEQRKAMILEVYKNVIVKEIMDHPNDQVWSTVLDAHVFDVGAVQHSEEGPILYGGRDSFLAHYHGRCRTFMLPPLPRAISGTAVRDAVEVKHTRDFREGMIYASKHKFPTSYQCVDVAVLDYAGRILMGQKKEDEGKWRFIGGFVAPTDASLEAAAIREVAEETTLDVEEPKYVGSARINDYRYPVDSPDGLLSAFFCVYVDPNDMRANPKASDDLHYCEWKPIDSIVPSLLIPEHEVLLSFLSRFYYGDADA